MEKSTCMYVCVCVCVSVCTWRYALHLNENTVSTFYPVIGGILWYKSWMYPSYVVWSLASLLSFSTLSSLVVNRILYHTHMYLENIILESHSYVSAKTIETIDKKDNVKPPWILLNPWIKFYFKIFYLVIEWQCYSFKTECSILVIF
jgi:hypothetical protein